LRCHHGALRSPAKHHPPRAATRGRLANALLGTGSLVLALSPIWRHRPEWPCVLFALVVLVSLVLDSPPSAGMAGVEAPPAASEDEGKGDAP